MLTSRECAQIIAQAWLDEEFKSLLEKDPTAALKQYGIETDAVLPVQARPEGLKDEELEVISENRKRAPLSARTSGCPKKHNYFFTPKSMEIKESNLLFEEKLSS